MSRIREFFASMLICSLLFFPIHPLAAVATPSDATPYEDGFEKEVNRILRDLDWDDLDDMDKMALFDLYLQSLSGPGLSTASNASLANIESMLSDIRLHLIPKAEETEVFLEDGFPVGDDVSPLALPPDFSLDRNVVIYEGTWQGQECRLVLPASTAVTLFVGGDGSLYNVGTSNIVGKVFYGGFEPLVYNNQYVFTLTPSLNNNASTLYSHGYPSYCTRYYYSSGSLRSSVTYGLFKVSRVVHTPSDLPESMNGVYLLVLILIGGVIILCCWKKSSK